MAAVAEIRHRDVVTYGMALLDGEHGDEPFKDGGSGYCVLGATQFASLSEGDPAVAQQLVKCYRGRLDRWSQGNASLRLLSLLAARVGARPVGAEAAIH